MDALSLTWQVSADVADHEFANKTSMHSGSGQ